MKFNKENIKKLREGKAMLVADHSKPELMDKVLKEAFPKDKENYVEYPNYKYYYAVKPLDGDWDVSDSFYTGERIPLADFFESEKPYKPKTAEERDKLVKELQAMEFKKDLPSELENVEFWKIKVDEGKLIALLRMRDVYCDGWVSDTKKDIHVVYIDTSENRKFTCGRFRGHVSSQFSFQDQETAELFLNNFRKELEQVKHLIS